MNSRIRTDITETEYGTRWDQLRIRQIPNKGGDPVPAIEGGRKARVARFSKSKRVRPGRSAIKLHDASAHAKLVSPAVREMYEVAMETAKDSGKPVVFDSADLMDWQHLILAHNPQANRPINPKTIRFLMRRLRSGRDLYMMSHPIVINSEGFLENGQHRAWACVLTGIPSRHVIVVGVKPGSEQNTDSNLTAVDRWVREAVDNKRNTNRVATLRLLYYADRGVRTEAPDDILYEFGNSINPDMDFKRAMEFAASPMRRVLCYPRVLGTAYYMLSKSPTDPSGAIEFLHQTVDMTGGSGRRKFSKAATSLRNRLAKLKTMAKMEKALRGDSGAIEMICTILVAWNECPNVPSDYRWQEDTLFPEVR